MRPASTAFIAVLVLLAGWPSPADDCWSRAAKQSDRNWCAELEYREADAELNRVYKKVLGLGNDEFKRLMREAQRAWLKYRDAHLASVYPTGYHYATMRPMCERAILAKMVKDRTTELRRFLPDYDDEDICNHYGPENAFPKSDSQPDGTPSPSRPENR